MSREVYCQNEKESIIPWIRNSIREFGDRSALIYKNNRYTYSELDNISGKLAAYLKDHGIKHGDVVPVLVPRCEYMSIAALGVLRAGGAYQPLDASHPVDRIRFMIEDADASVVIVSRELEYLIDCSDFEKAKPELLYMEDIASLPEPAEDIWEDMSGDDRFVILYTSGTTGVPKGIILTHGNIYSACRWHLKYYDVNSDCRMGQHASYVFDLAIVELLLPLTAGASVYIIPEELRTDLSTLNSFLENNRITHLTMTTQLGRQFAMTIDNHSLRHLTVGGEALISVVPPKGYILHNDYGPAECTLYTTIFAVEKDYPEKVPIGRAVDEVELYVVDENGLEAADNTVGELCIAGPHVAYGYLNRPELTEKSFTANPFSDKPGYERMYHSGDLVLRNSDGIFEYFGRADRQVKIRGVRIEPAEIEALLRTYEEINEVVITTPEVGGQRVIAAYYLADKELDSKLLEEFVLTYKPSYMCPSFFVRINEIPLNTNGKVDQKKLPIPSFEMYKAVYEEPVNDTEKILSRIYAEILKTDHIGRNDDFMLIGGNSILIAGLIYRIEKELSVRLSIRDVMENSVVSALGSKICEMKKDGNNVPEEMMSDEALPESESYDVSMAQERIYTAQNLLEDDDPTYLLSAVIHTEKDLDDDSIKMVLARLFEAHESLRTGFHMTEEGLVQKINEADEAWIKRAVDESRTDKKPSGFKLDKAPLFRWKYDNRSLTLYWHHIINDGVGISMFAQEFVSCYNGSEPEENRIHQKEYAAFERKQRTSGTYDKGLEFWKKLLAQYDDIHELQLVQDGIYSASERKQAGHEYGNAGRQLSERLDEFCKGNGVTPYMFLMTSYLLLLYKYSGQRRFITGTVMDGRSEQLTERMQGMFVSTIPVIVDISEGITFLELLEQIKNRILDCHRFKSIALEDIAEGFASLGGYVRTSHDHLLFDSLFTMRDFETKLQDIDGKKAWITFPEDEMPMYDLTLETGRDEEGYNYFFEYDTGLYTEESVHMMSEHYVNLIENCIEGPEQNVDMISMTDDKEVRELLRLAKDDECPFIQDTVITRIENRVKETPDKTALLFKDETVSYADLWNRSGRIAVDLVNAYEDSEAGNRLHDVDVAEDGNKERRVMLIAERSTGMISSILGILRSGAGYVPVSPEYPEERIRYVLKDCRPDALIICGCELPAGIKKQTDRMKIKVIDVQPVGSGQKNGTKEAYENTKLPAITMQQIAYMIYTSGTTGEPKGVVVEHKQLSGMLDAYGQVYGINSDDTVLQFANYVFDQSVWDIFHILTIGGTLCLITQELNKDPEALVSYCETRGVTVASLTPGYLRLLSPEKFKSLRILDVGGEAPDRSLLEMWSAGRTVFNTYGPTETTVNASSYVFAQNGVIGNKAFSARENVPIGRPAPGVSIYIMNKDKLCGFGVPGELCIAGTQVARGYFNRPELTAEKFGNDPFGNGRMYRSGDLARMMPDGNIEFMNRMDDQVKIRGYRIELGEVEAALRSFSAVRNAVVVLKDNNGEKLLCGYFIPEKDSDADILTIREELEKKIPAYMVPSVFIPVKEFVLTVNGKINRNLLPDPSEAVSIQIQAQDYQAPVTREERDCCRAFEKILGISNISVADNFLSLGGDSIKAIRIVSLLRERGYSVDAATILKSHTIKGLAAVVKRTGNISYLEYETVRPTPVMRMFVSADMPEPSYYNQSAVFIINGVTDTKALEWAINGLIYCHGMLRMYLKDDGRPGIRRRDEMPPFELSVYKGLSEKEREEMMNSIHSSLDPDNGIVFGAAVFEDTVKSRLFLTFHHYVIDEVSWDIIFEDINILYEHARSSRAYEKKYEKALRLLKKGTVSFGEWSESLWKYRDSDAFSAEGEYWTEVHNRIETEKKKLNKWKEMYMRTDGISEHGYGIASGYVDREATDRLFELSDKRYGARVDALLAAVLAKTVFDTDGSNILLFQMESHGRAEARILPKTDRTVGWFTAVYPILIGAFTGIDDQITEMKEVLAAIPNSGIGYGLMYDDLTDMGGLVFNYLGGRKEEQNSVIQWSEESSGTEISPLNVDPKTISVNIRDTKQGLKIECIYDLVFDKKKIDSLIENYESSLRTLADTVMDTKRIYTPSDLCADRLLSKDEWDIVTKKYSPWDIEVISSLTPLQQGMLYRHLAEPDSGAYLLQDRLTIKGEWSLINFRTALRALFIRYDALRIRIMYNGLSEPVQIVLKEGAIKPEIVRIPGKDMDEVIADDLRRGINPAKDPMLRVTFTEEPGRNTVWDKELLITTHHCILDGWSFPILIDTLVNYYQMLLRGVSGSALFAMAGKERHRDCSYADFLRSRGNISVHEKIGAWNKYLDGIDEGTSLMHVNSTENAGNAAGFVTFPISGQKKECIQRFAEKYRITTGCFFGCIWGILLGFENNTKEVIFGETVSGRENGPEGIINAVGMFINTVPVRIRLDDNKYVSEIFRQRQEDYYTMQSVLDAPLDKIGSDGVKASDLIRSLYVYENYPESDTDGGSYVLDMLHEEVDYPISVSVEEGNGFTISIQYDTGSYDRRYIDLLAGRYINIIDQVISDRDIKMSALGRIPADERRTMLGQVAGVRADFGKQTVLDMIYEKVVQTPDAVAVAEADRVLSYHELWEQSCLLAERIGYGEERFIALYTDRGAPMMTAMLAVLIAGAAYVPLDPSYPDERIRYIMNDCGAKVVIRNVNAGTDERDDLFAVLGTKVIDVLDEKTVAQKVTEVNMEYPWNKHGLTGNRLAYMIYTSGTAGEPKGVEVEHGALVQMVRSNIEYYGPFDTAVLQAANYVFDASVQEIFVTLASGGTVCTIPVKMLRSAEETAKFCKDKGVRIIITTNALLQALDPEQFDDLRLVCVGGDAANVETFAAWSAHTDMLVNDYGPTEGCVNATVHKYTGDDKTVVPIGMPYKGKRVFIMQGNELCGIGQKGEICIGGTGLARGYHNRDEMNRLMFTDNPYEDGLIYHTGDIGAFGLDEELRFLGRKDDQIKIRGYRIETGEIENCIRKYDKVSEVAVISRKEGKRESYLAAYVVAGDEIDMGQLRNYLYKNLPSYMVPAFIINMKELPLTSSGKLDIKSLPVMTEQAGYTAPVGYFEQFAAKLFEKILGVEHVGRNDSFFELGGSSIDLMKLVSGLGRYNISVTDVAAAPTPLLLGERMLDEWNGRERKGSGIMLLKEGNEDRPTIFCIPPSGGMSLCYMPVIEEIGHEGRIFGLSDDKYNKFDRMSFEELSEYDVFSENLWEDTVKKYTDCVSEVFKDGDILVGYSQGGNAAHSVAMSLEKQGFTIGKIIMLECVPPSQEGTMDNDTERFERLKTAVAIFTGSSVDRDDETFSEETEDVVYLKNELKTLMGEDAAETLLKSLYETYLVYSSNVCNALRIKGKVNAEIDSIILTEELSFDSGYALLETDPWLERSQSRGKSYGIFGNDNDHLVFLSKYKIYISEIVKNEILK